jgi:6-phosphogluconolactonase (cycloisomerase 2 family)
VLQTFDFSSIPTGPHDRQDASHPHGVHLDPSGGYILAPDLGGDVVHIFAIDQETGSLTECDAAATEPGDGPRHAAYWTVSDGGNAELVFTVNELANTVTAWDVSYPEEEGGCLSLSPLQTLSTLPEGVDPPEGSKAAEIRVRDNFVYVSNRYDRSFGDEQDSLATFEIVLPINGTLELTFVELTNSESYFPRTFQINAEGNLVAVGGQTSSNVVILERNVENGRLGDVVAQVQVGDVGTPLEEDGLSAVIWVE